MIPTHAVTSNGHIHMDVDDEIMPIPSFLHRVLGNLDGTESHARSLWRLPEGKGLYECPEDWPLAYIQSAGSAGAMTVEIRVSHGMDAIAEHFVVGRPVDDQLAEPLVEIPWDEYKQTVFANEVFDANEAGDLFWYYYQHNTVPEHYMLRKLDL